MVARKRESLSRARVLAAAVDLADREGLQAVTMRGLASELGVEAMSLYYHLPSKEALLDGLIESVATEVGLAVAELPSADDWRAEVRERCLAARAVMLRHPWAPELIGSRTAIPPAVYGHFEAILGAMVEGGLSYHLAHRGLHALGSMALGFVQELFKPDTDADADMSEEVMMQMAEALPHMTAMVASEIHAHDGDVLGWCDSQAEFEFTLDLLLDGLDRQASAADQPG